MKYLRRRAQLTQRELAIAVGYSESLISRLEADQRVPDRASLTALFVPALLIEDEPEIIARLVELARLGKHRNWQSSTHTGDPATPESGTPAAARKKGLSGSLPIQLTSFIGREKEILALRRMVGTGPARLVTLTGAGGVGKTRLAIRVAEELLDYFEDGAWLVELAPVSDPEYVAPAAVATLGLIPQPGQTATQVLSAYLCRKRLLLVLDNCEHVVRAAAGLAETLLRACTNLRILALPDTLSRFPPQTAYWGVDVPGSAAGRLVQEFFSTRGTPQTRLEAGQSLDLGGGVRLDVLACAEGGCALRLEYGNFTALLPGGNPPATLSASDLTGLSVVLFGSLDELENWQGVDAMLALSPADIPTGGWVHVRTDGEQMWVEEGR